MANKKISDGVGKKIVEALKKQSEIEINPVPNSKSRNEEPDIFDEISEKFEDTTSDIQESSHINNIEDSFSETFSDLDENFNVENPSPIPAAQTFTNYQSISSAPQDNFIKDLESFEIPNNIAVLKKLISQLPSGVTRQTGAQIIKQTMEALGISMKSVLQEAQQVQDGLNTSVKECNSNVQEYKKQIIMLEKQAQNYQRQYSALNELISLFIQTGM